MLWVLFALIAPVMWALNNILDKFILTKKMRNPYTFNILTMMFDLVPLFLIMLFFPLSAVYPWSIVAFLIGFIVVPALYLYNKALMFEEASRVGSLTHVYPIFVAILAFIFLRESFDAAKYLGIAFLVLGAVMISYKQIRRKKFVISSALALMLGYSLLWAADSVITDYALNFFDFWSLYAWSLVGSFTGGLLMLLPKKGRKRFYSDVNKSGRKGVFYVFLTSCVFYIGELSFMAGLALGSASLTSALSSTQPFFTLVFASTISLFYPRILEESTDKLSIALKLTAIILIFAGAYFVTAA